MAQLSASAQPHLESVRAMLVETLGDRLSPGIVDYADLFTEDGVLEIPLGDALRLEGLVDSFGRLDPEEMAELRRSQPILPDSSVAF